MPTMRHFHEPCLGSHLTQEITLVLSNNFPFILSTRILFVDIFKKRNKRQYVDNSSFLIWFYKLDQK